MENSLGEIRLGLLNRDRAESEPEHDSYSKFTNEDEFESKDETNREDLISDFPGIRWRAQLKD